jgi:hypothetical protein
MDQTHKLMVKAGVAVNGWKGKKSASVSRLSTPGRLGSADMIELQKLGIEVHTVNGQNDTFQSVSHSFY